MATSGSYNFSVTAAQICTAAFEDLGLIDPGQSVNTNDQATLLQRLNFIAKQWQGKADMAQGLKIHTRQRVTLFLAKNQYQYTVGPASTDSNATTSYGRTTTTAAKAAGQTVLAITSNSDTTTYPGTTVSMTNADYVGVQQTDGTIFWTTISTSSSTSVTLNSSLTVGCNSGAYVYWYTAKAQRFPVIEFASLRDSNIIDLPVRVFTDVQEYERLTNKTATGNPIRILVEPLRLNTRVTTDFAVSDVTRQLRLTVQYPAEDYDATSDDIAFPQEWYDALHWELAFRAAPIFGVQWTPEMKMNHDVATAIAREVNPDNSSAYFQPGREWY